MKEFFTKRLIVAIITGAVLGVFCIIGASVRYGSQAAPAMLASLWYNRLIMGFVIGLYSKAQSLSKAMLRGAVTGLLISFAFFLSGGMSDYVSFLVGIVYGLIIELTAYKLDT